MDTTFLWNIHGQTAKVIYSKLNPQQWCGKIKLCTGIEIFLSTGRDMGPCRDTFKALLA